MFASVLSAAILGMDVHPIQVEADVSDGLPTFTMVGFPSAQVKEAQDRVRTALKNNGIALPPKRITVNFAPADIKKEGAGFDLPLAAAVLAASDILKSEQLELAKNEIYARHGRQFVTDYIADYFNSKSWYQGTIDPDTFDAEQNSIFNEYELANISKIAEWEEQKASQGN